MTVPLPTLVHVLHIDAETGAPQEVGVVPGGLRRLIPVLGGTACGPLLTGTILPGGADLQLVTTPEQAEVDARYVIRTDQDEMVLVQNLGIRRASAADVRRLREELPVPPERVYFASTPRFETAAPRLAVLTQRVHVGVGTRSPGRVQFDFYAVVGPGRPTA